MSWTQKRRAKIILNSYRKWNLKGKKVLDAGCGNGVVSQILKAELEIDLCGTDIADYLKADIPFKKMNNPTSLPFEDSSFDYVMFNDVLHHLYDVEFLLLEAKRVGGDVLVFEDEPHPLLNIIDKVLNFFYYSKMPCPLNFKTEKGWCALFNKLGFNCETGKAAYPVCYPFRNMVFKLVKKA